jgi:hypothetical protein
MSSPSSPVLSRPSVPNFVIDGLLCRATYNNIRITFNARVTRLHIATLNCSMDKLKVAGQNLFRVFNSELRHACISREIAYVTKQPNLKLKLWPTTFRLSPISFRAPLIVPITLSKMHLGTIGECES